MLDLDLKNSYLKNVPASNCLGLEIKEDIN